MWFRISIFFCQYLIFHSRSSFTEAKALIGQNVRPATEYEFTFIVAIVKSYLRIRLPTNLICTGTLISKSDILTSEHCLEDEFLIGLRIIIGSSNLSRGTEYYPEWWISYDQWATYKNIEIEFESNDIAILNLLECVPDAIDFAYLWPVPFNDLAGSNVQTAGWGSLANEIFPVNLCTVFLVILSNTTCASIVERYIHQPIEIDQQTICTVGNPYALLGTGDSGGPLFIRNYIVAVNAGSFPISLPDNHPDKINIHIHVLYYQEFLSDILGF